MSPLHLPGPAGNKLRNVRTPMVPITFSAGTEQRAEIPRSLLGRQLSVRISGNLVIAVANATIFPEAPLGLIKAISIKADGSVKTFQSMDGRMAYRLSQLIRRSASELSPPLNTVGTRAFSCLIPIDFESWRLLAPNETLFEPRRFGKVELCIQWGSETDIAAAGGGGTIAISGVVTDIEAVQVGTGIEGIGYDRTIVQVTTPILASNPKLQIRVPQAGVLTGTLIRATRDLGAGAGPGLVDNIVNTMSLISDQLVTHDATRPWATVQRQNVPDFQIVQVQSTTPGLPLAGYAFMDRVENGSIASALNVSAINETLLQLDVTRTGNTENLDVVFEFLEPRAA